MFAVRFGLRIFIDPPGAVHLCWPESSSNDLYIYIDISVCVCVCVCVAIGEKIERLYFYPYKPVSWLLTHHGISVFSPYRSLYLALIQRIEHCKRKNQYTDFLYIYIYIYIYIGSLCYAFFAGFLVNTKPNRYDHRLTNPTIHFNADKLEKFENYITPLTF